MSFLILDIFEVIWGKEINCGSKQYYNCKLTNYIQWNFLRSLNDKVEKEECSLRLTPNGPERESLKEIAEKIYGML